MNKITTLIITTCIFSFNGLCQWEPQIIYANRAYDSIIQVQVNKTENQTRILDKRTGETQILNHVINDYRFNEPYMFLKVLNVLNDQKTEVIFFIYRISDCHFIRKVSLNRKTYDYSIVENGEEFQPHLTIPNKKVLFFVLHEDCECTPSGKTAYLFYGEGLSNEKNIPLIDKKLGLWINDDLTEITTVTSRKQVIKHSLTDRKTIWELSPPDFSCKWINYDMSRFDNILCLNGVDTPSSFFVYYFIDMDTGQIIGEMDSGEKTSNSSALYNYCQNLLEGKEVEH